MSRAPDSAGSSTGPIQLRPRSCATSSAPADRARRGRCRHPLMVAVAARAGAGASRRRRWRVSAHGCGGGRPASGGVADVAGAVPRSGGGIDGGVENPGRVYEARSGHEPVDGAGGGTRTLTSSDTGTGKSCASAKSANTRALLSVACRSAALIAPEGAGAGWAGPWSPMRARQAWGGRGPGCRWCWCWALLRASCGRRGGRGAGRRGGGEEARGCAPGRWRCWRGCWRGPARKPRTGAALEMTVVTSPMMSSVVARVELVHGVALARPGCRRG